jgi:photosystem II stability/assembly factor-like uncharacterized protein
MKIGSFQRVSALLSALLLLSSLSQVRAYSVASFAQPGGPSIAARFAATADGGMLRSADDGILKNGRSAPDRIKASQKLDMTPLYFEPNLGRTDPRVKYFSRNKGLSLSITESGTVLSLDSFEGSDRGPRYDQANGSPISLGDSGPRGRDMVSASIVMKLAGANQRPVIEGMGRLRGTVNYISGSDPKNWHTDIPTYARVRESAVYPGIDLSYYGNGCGLEYDFLVSPGADPRAIKLDFGGARKLSLDADGNLLLDTNAGQIVEHRPMAYQEFGAVGTKVASRYVIKGKRRAEIRLASYDRTKPVVIDPSISFSTYLGRGNGSAVNAVAVDSSDAVYAVGAITNGLLGQNNINSQGSNLPGFNLMKFGSDGTLVYSTQIYGQSIASSLAVDSAGCAYVAGSAFNYGTAGGHGNYPTTPGAFEASPPVLKGWAPFITKFSATGSALVYSTFLGRDRFQQPTMKIAVDSSGFAYVAGSTLSPIFPTTPGSFQAQKPSATSEIGQGPAANCFVTKIDQAGSNLVYSTYLGGNGGENPAAIAVDSAGDVYVTGSTISTNFPITPGAYLTSNGQGGSFGFVTKFNPSGSGLVYSTLLSNDGTIPVALRPTEYLGMGFGSTNYGTGSVAGAPTGIAVDPSGNAYITGACGPGFPVLNAIQPTTMIASALRTDDASATIQVVSGLPALFAPVSIVYDRAEPSTMYIGGYVDLSGPAIYKSTDGGRTWSGLTMGLPGQEIWATLAIDPQNTSTLYACVSDTSGSHAGLDVHVYKTTDGGASWSPLALSVVAVAATITVDPQAPSNLYLSGNGMASLKSTDSGARWTRITKGLPTKNCQAVVVDPSDSAVLYLGTGNGVFKSINGGKSWNPTPVTAAAYSVAIDPVNPSIIYAATPLDSSNAVGAAGDGRGNPRRRTGQSGPLAGVLKSYDGGASWSPINTGLKLQLVGQDQQNFQIAPGPIAIDPNNSQTLYLGSDGPTYKSTDGGDTWLLPPALLDTGAFSIGINPANSGVFFGVAIGAEHAFVSELNASGSALLYSTFLGGLSSDGGTSIAVDGSGNAYIAGYTTSSTFPVTSSAIQAVYGGQQDAFVAKISAGGSALEFSTFLGGNYPDFCGALAIDSSGNVYVGGSTQSSNFPTVNSFQGALIGGTTAGVNPTNGFLTKIATSSGAAADYSKPAIAQAGINGTAVTVSGQHFRAGAAVAINGNELPTVADPANPAVLAAQQSGPIEASQTYIIQVINADGTVSDPYCVSLAPPPP